MKPQRLLAWLALGLVFASALPWLLRRANPLLPREWSVSNAEARVIGLERLRDLGEPPANPYVIVNPHSEEVRRARLIEAHRAGRSAAELQASHAYRDFFGWRVTLYDRTRPAHEWSYRARITPVGEIVQLERRIADGEGGGAVEPAAARAEADAFLVEQGFALADYEEPEVRTKDLEARTDTTLRYRDRERLFGEPIAYGLEVKFAGEELVGFSTWVEDPQEEAIEQRAGAIELLSQVWIFSPVLLAPLIAVPFLRRYHAGEIGVRRGLQEMAVVMVSGLVILLFCVRGIGESWGIGNLTRPQVILVIFFQMLILYFLPMAMATLLAWSVGESLCRERHGRLLAAMDALFRGEWRNATFARAALVGTVAGLLLTAVVQLLAIALEPLGFESFDVIGGPPWWSAAASFSIPLVLFALVYALYATFVGQLFLASLLRRRVGRWLGGALATAAAAAIFFPPLFGRPLVWTFVLSIVAWGLTVAVFFRFGIFATLIAQVVAMVTPAAVPLLAAGDPSLQTHASVALLLVGVPLVMGARHLASKEEFVYRYEDVPPHVRRIAERERQKVELETARNIQSSILPVLPPEVNGLRMAHAYLPATEVGGDFYDVLALEDGRVAVAVGDVAGHGVSSGLVMSMAKSALAVQVTFDPEVEAVFATLNRMVYQSARKRLLTTLCYALIDPRRRELLYGSAGHLFPYRITGGRVLALESVSYPLGVRDELDIRVRSERLEAGDLLFLFSDGVVEARAEGSDEPFGFERLEASLGRHSGDGVVGLRDGILADLAGFTGEVPREDDLTVLAVEVP